MSASEIGDALWTSRRFRAVPLVVEALQFDGWNIEEVAAFTGLAPDDSSPLRDALDHIVIETPDGEVIAYVSDWVIRGTEGEMWVRTDTQFTQAYEPMDED